MLDHDTTSKAENNLRPTAEGNVLYTVEDCRA